MKIVLKEHPKLFVNKSTLDAFWEIPPDSKKGYEIAHANFQKRTYQREALADILQNYNTSIKNDKAAFANINRLKKPDSYCVITGQQLGLMGGPVYTLLKAVTCLHLAKKYNAVPIFWWATEDHDVAEIDHTYLLDAVGNLQEYKLHFPHDGHAVETLLLNAKSCDEIYRFLSTVGQSDLSHYVTEGSSYATTMASLMAQLFAGTGLVFIEPKWLRPLSIPFFQHEVANAQAIHNVLQSTADDLKKIGEKPSIPISKDTNLFFINNHGVRHKICKDSSGFIIDQEKYTLTQLQNLITEHPEQISTNVAARPVLQSWLFPTLAYLAGPSEMQYYLQLKAYHQLHGVHMPWIVPRISATFVPAVDAATLEKIHLDPWDNIPAHWATVTPEVEQDNAKVQGEWLSSAQRYYGNDVSEDALKRLIKYAALKIQKRALRKRLRQSGIDYSALHRLNNLLKPHGKPQERVLNWWTFQMNKQKNFIGELLKSIVDDNKGHYYFLLE